jgi:hypothetical protein
MGFRRDELVTHGEDGLDGGAHGDAIVFFLGVREFVVGDEAGVFLFLVVSMGAEGPAIGEALGGPDVVSIFGEAFHEVFDERGQRDMGGIERLGMVGRRGHEVWQYFNTRTCAYDSGFDGLFFLFWRGEIS